MLFLNTFLGNLNEAKLAHNDDAKLAYIYMRQGH